MKLIISLCLYYDFISIYILDRFMITLIHDSNIQLIRKKTFALSVTRIPPFQSSCLNISRHGQRLQILTPGKLATPHTNVSLYLRSRVFL